MELSETNMPGWCRPVGRASCPCDRRRKVFFHGGKFPSDVTECGDCQHSSPGFIRRARSESGGGGKAEPSFPFSFPQPYSARFTAPCRRPATGKFFSQGGIREGRYRLPSIFLRPAGKWGFSRFGAIGQTYRRSFRLQGFIPVHTSCLMAYHGSSAGGEQSQDRAGRKALEKLAFELLHMGSLYVRKGHRAQRFPECAVIALAFVAGLFVLDVQPFEIKISRLVERGVGNTTGAVEGNRSSMDVPTASLASLSLF